MELYSTLPRSERDKIAALQMEIEAGLDPNLPGHSKYLGAWEQWSKADCMTLEGELSESTEQILCASSITLEFLREAEEALWKEKNATTNKEKYSVKAVEALEIAAMVRGLYWPYEVAKAMDKKNKKPRVTNENTGE